MKISGTLPVTIELNSIKDVEDLLAWVEEDPNRHNEASRQLVSYLYRVLPEPPGQVALFDAPQVAIEKIFPTNLVEWAHGQEAGWRGDELVGPKSDDFMLGYGQGLASKESYQAWKAIELAKVRVAGD